MTCCATKHLTRRPDNLEWFSFYIQRRVKCVMTGAMLHVLRASFKHFVPPPNGLRYPLVGGTRQRHFDGTSFKPRKLPENAATPTSRVHAVLGNLYAFQNDG